MFMQKFTSESSTDRVPWVSVIPSSSVQGLQVGVAETVVPRVSVCSLRDPASAAAARNL